VTDVFDQATVAEEKHRAWSLAKQAELTRVQRDAKPGDWRKLSAKWCKGIGCGERIPDERRRAIPGVQLCAECKMRDEQQERRGR